MPELDELEGKLHQFQERGQGGTVKELRQYLQQEQQQKDAEAAEKEAAFRRNWKVQRDEILRNHAKELSLEIDQDHAQQRARLQEQMRQRVAEQASAREEDLSVQRAQWKGECRDLLEQFSECWRSIHKDGQHVDRDDVQVVVAEGVRKVEEAMALHHKAQLQKWEAAQNGILQRFHQLDEELIRAEEEQRHAVHREAEQLLAAYDTQKREEQASSERRLSARERELHFTLLGLEPQREDYDQEARAKYEKLLQEHRDARVDDARNRVKRACAQLQKAADNEEGLARAYADAVEVVEHKAPVRAQEVLEELRATWSRKQAQLKLAAEEKAFHAHSPQIQQLRERCARVEPALAWPDVDDAVPAMQEHHAAIKQKLLAHQQQLQRDLEQHKQNVEDEVRRLLGAPPPPERTALRELAAGELHDRAEAAERFFADIDRAVPEQLEAKYLAQLAHLARHTEKAREYWHTSWWHWRCDRPAPPAPLLGPLLRDVLTALGDTWEVLQVPQHERDAVGEQVLQALGPLGPQAQPAVQAELEALADRQRLEPALLERDECLALERAGRADLASQGKLATLEQFLAVSVKEYEERHGTRLRHQGRLVIEELLSQGPKLGTQVLKPPDF